MLVISRLKILAPVLLLLSACTTNPPVDPVTPSPVATVTATSSPTASLEKAKRPKREWGPPVAGLSGRFKGLLERQGVTLVEPTREAYLDQAGVWNGKEVEFSFKYKDKLYSNLDDIPGLPEEFRGRRGRRGVSHTAAIWTTYLENLSQAAPPGPKP